MYIGFASGVSVLWRCWVSGLGGVLLFRGVGVFGLSPLSGVLFVWGVFVVVFVFWGCFVVCFGLVWYCLGAVQPLFCLRVVSVGCGGLWLVAGDEGVFPWGLGRCFWYE